jgi:hypothetical protein
VSRSAAPRWRVPAGVGLVAVWLVAAGVPALADPPGPTHYDSVVIGVETADGDPAEVEVEVLGGDAFLLLRVPPGTQAEVPGYDGEPYVRVLDDGAVEVNQRAPTHWYNEDRYGADVPALADAEASPVWREVADGGTYAWHDHRIHWMSPQPPDRVDPSRREIQEVWDWEVPLLVDGREVLVRGELAWHPGPPVWTSALLVVLALGLAGALVFALRVPVARLTVGGGLVAGVAGLAQVAGQPPGGEGDLFLVALPAVALGAAVLVLALRRRDPAQTPVRLLDPATGLPLLVWGVLQAGSVTRPIVPEPLTGASLRPVAAAALAIGVVAVVALARDGLRLLPDPLSDDAEPGAPAL